MAVFGTNVEEDENADPDPDVHQQRSPRLRRDERQHEARVGDDERQPDPARFDRNFGKQAQRHQHGAAEARPARCHEEPIPLPVPVSHYRVPCDMPRVVVLPESAGDVGAQLVRQRRDQSRDDEKDVVIVVTPTAVGICLQSFR